MLDSLRFVKYVRSFMDGRVRVRHPALRDAAIAGKALLKPTVVGAAGATSHIRDGLMVAVDCAHGSVQRLQG